MSHNENYDARPWNKNYPAGNSPDLPAMPYTNIPDMITRVSQKYSNRKAFTVCLPNGMAASLTFAEIDTLSDAFALYLTHELNLSKGERVAVQMPNCLAYPIAMFGVLKAGLILVNVNPLYTTTEMEHQFNDSGAKALIIIDLFGDKLGPVIPRTHIRNVILVSLADFFPLPLKAIIKLKLKLTKQIPLCTIQSIPFTTAISIGKSRLNSGAKPGVSPGSGSQNTMGLNDTAVLQYTGGTTGVSKGADLSHSNILSNMLQINEVLKPRLDKNPEVILTALPLYHIFAFTVNCLTIYSLGGHNVLVPSPRPMSNLKKAFEKYEFTLITGVNTLFNALLQEPWFMQNPPTKLKAAVAGGTALQSAVAERWMKAINVPIYEGFGLTESSPVLSIQPIGGKIKPDSVGIPTASTYLRCVDDNGVTVAVGERGELIAKGPQVMRGYWNRPEETAKTIKDGWLYTGDIATMDENGYFSIVDRKKDMILVSGFNVYPNEVEDAIMKHAKVSEVCVIGVPDASSGEAVRAFVIAKDASLTSEELREHCKKTLTNYKVPKSVEFRKELPKTPVGKILRKDLRAEVLAQK